jgi:hypothetical protein
MVKTLEGIIKSIQNSHVHYIYILYVIIILLYIIII